MSTVAQVAIISGVVGAVVLVAGVVIMANMVVRHFEQQMAWLGEEIRRELGNLRDDVRRGVRETDEHAVKPGGGL